MDREKAAASTRSGRVVKPKIHKDGTVTAPVAVALKQDPVFDPSPSPSGRDDAPTSSGRYIDRNDFPDDNDHSSQDGSPRSNSVDGRLDSNGQPSSRPPRPPRTSNSRKPPSGGSKGDRVGISGGGIFKQAAVEVLRQEGRLLTTGEITRLALRRQLINCSGKTPDATMASALYTDIKRKESQSVFIRPNEGKFGLREWVEVGGLPARFFVQDAGLVSDPTVAAAAAAAAVVVSGAGSGALAIPPSSTASAGGVGMVPPSVQLNIPLPPQQQQQQQYHSSRPSSSTVPPPPPMFNHMPDGLMELLSAAEVAGELSSDDDVGVYGEEGDYAALGRSQYSDMMRMALENGDRGGNGGEVGTYGSKRVKRKVGRPAKYRQPTSSGADFLAEVLRSQAGGGGGPGRRKRGSSGGGGGRGRGPSRLGQQQQHHQQQHRNTSSAYADEDEDDLLTRLGQMEDGVGDEDDEYEGSFSAAMMAMMGGGGKRKRPVFTLPPPITYEAPRYVPPPVISPEQDEEERKKGGEASYYAPGAMEEKGNKEQVNSLNVGGNSRNSRKGKRGGSATQQGGAAGKGGGGAGAGASIPPPQQQQQAAVEENLSLQQVEERVASLEQTLGASHPEVGKGYLYLARRLMADSTMPEQSRHRAELALTRAQEIMTVCQYAMRRTEGPSCGLSFTMVHQQIYLAAAAAAMQQQQEQQQQQQLQQQGQGVGPGVNDGSMAMDPHSLAAIAAAAAVAPFHSP